MDNKAFCDERTKNIENKLDILFHKSENIEKILLGNGKLGFVAKINILWGLCSFAACTSLVAIIKSFLK